MATAGGQREDPIEEDESDIVSARTNVKKPWARTSSPPRRLRTSMSIQASAANNDNLLPPYLRSSGSQPIKGQPITLQRPANDSPPSNVSYGRPKPHNSLKLGAFKPRNTLSRSTPTQPFSKGANGSPGLNSTLDGPRKKRRKLKDLMNISDGEDELAGPGVDKSQSSSPIKKKPLTEASPSSASKHEQFEQAPLCTVHSNNPLEESISGNGDVPPIELQKQKRERRQRQTMLKNRKQRVSETISPYFADQPGDLHSEEISARHTSGRPLISHPEDSGIVDIVDPEEHQTSLSLAENSTAIRRKSDRASKNQELHRKHEKSWPIKSFQTDTQLYEQGLVELVVDKQTQRLRFRVDDQLMSFHYPMGSIYGVKFSDTLIRLHFRGIGYQIAWIVTNGNAPAIIECLQRIQNFKAEPEDRAEQKFAKWNAEHVGNSSTSPSKIFEDKRTTPHISPTNKLSAANHKRPVTSPGDPLVQEQGDDGPRPKRMKLNARMLEENTRDDLSKSPTTPGKPNRPASVLPADIGNSGLRRLALSRDKPDKPNINDKPADTIGIVGTKEKAKADFVANQAQESVSQAGESHDLFKKQAIHSSNRPIRLTRAQRQYAEFDQHEPMPTVEKYSKIHGLGPRWKDPLVWPKQGRKRVTVEFDDLERLDEEEFLNDNLVEFALRWLRQTAKDPPNIYWFNTYFFERLNKGKSKHIDYDGVKRWTKDIDLFSYDCVVVPINENYHWYLAIIYNLPRLKNGLSSNSMEDAKQTKEGSNDSVDLELLASNIRLNSPKTPLTDRSIFSGFSGIHDSLLTDGSELKTKSVTKSKGRIRDPLAPTIVTLDSLGLAHPQAITTLKSYLRAEAKERLDLTLEKEDIAGMTAKGIPSQDNLSDCGVYLLGYAAVMLGDPIDFRSKLLQKDFDEEADWQHLRPLELRSHLRRIIRKKHKHQVQRSLNKEKPTENLEELSSDFSSDDLQSLEPMVALKKRVNMPQLNSGTNHAQNPRIITTPKNTADGSPTEMKTVHDENEDSSQATLQTHPLESSIAHSIRVKPFDGSSFPTSDHHEVPETPQGSPTRTPPQLPLIPNITPTSDGEPPETNQSLPSTPLSAASSFSQDSLL